MSRVRDYIRGQSLPALIDAGVRDRQERILERQELLKAGVMPSKKLLGFIPRPPRPMTIEDRYGTLQALLSDYQGIIEALGGGEGSYRRFFVELCDQYWAEVRLRATELRDAERQRIALLGEATAGSDDDIRITLELQGEQLRRSVQLLGRSGLLFAKKVELSIAALERFAEDQEVQRKALESIAQQLDARHKAFELQKRIDRIGEHIEELANAALNFERDMGRMLGPLQTLIERVADVDARLQGSVAEIEKLSRAMEDDRAVAAIEPGGLGDALLSYLVASRVKQDRLLDVAHALAPPETAEGDESPVNADDATSASVQDALHNVTTVLDVRLRDAVGTGSTAPRVNQVTIHFCSTWRAPHVHYGDDGGWTAVPGIAMVSEGGGWWVLRGLSWLGPVLLLTFNDGDMQQWDPGGGVNYRVPAGRGDDLWFSNGGFHADRP